MRVIRVSGDTRITRYTRSTRVTRGMCGGRETRVTRVERVWRGMRNMRITSGTRGTRIRRIIRNTVRSVRRRRKRIAGPASALRTAELTCPASWHPIGTQRPASQRRAEQPRYPRATRNSWEYVTYAPNGTCGNRDTPAACGYPGEPCHTVSWKLPPTISHKEATMRHALSASADGRGGAA